MNVSGEPALQSYKSNNGTPVTQSAIRNVDLRLRVALPNDLDHLPRTGCSVVVSEKGEDGRLLLDSCRFTFSVTPRPAYALFHRYNVCSERVAERDGNDDDRRA